MRSARSKTIHTVAFAVAVLLGWHSDVQAEQQLSDAELIASLKKGGYVIYVRHAATDVSVNDQNREDLSDWSKQRNLSDKGREQAHTIGLGFRKLGIPVGEVISSPYCRCIETGKLAFGKVKVSKDLAFSIGEDKSQAEKLAKALRMMLAAKPARGNTILIAHSGNLQDAAKLWPKPEGVAFIFQPHGNEAFELVQRVDPEKWTQLAQNAGIRLDAPAGKAALPRREQLCGTEQD